MLGDIFVGLVALCVLTFVIAVVTYIFEQFEK